MDTFFNEEMLETAIRLVTIIFLSGLIGLEREIKNRPAGLRTHILVGLGSCLLMLLSLNGFSEFIAENEGVSMIDPARIPSYVVSGIGFLGAGTILVQGRRGVQGLTTAASIWLVAAIGLVVGVGMYYEAIITTFIVFLTLLTLNSLEHKLKWKESKKTSLLSIYVVEQETTFNSIINILSDQKITVIKSNIESLDTKMHYTFLLRGADVSNQLPLLTELRELKEITKMTMDYQEALLE
ncbi:MgtC/SapB family protein [Bacillus suaedae]|uniref:MgtC/SapB family protein n=1 Tax=Halalkalibacter suaedae TaxID=2822140 RepID=A0A941AMF3_9BACI|nr:MgtC/SapB family protein [Bacillus suaedae]MBP3950455.1 MgtC/SapB family protein [Bacillus suaedae]